MEIACAEGSESKELGMFKQLNENQCATTTRSKRTFGERHCWRNTQGQITQGLAGCIKYVGLYHKFKKKPFKGFNERSNISCALKRLLQPQYGEQFTGFW